MKVEVSAKGTDLNAQIDPRFGRCKYFIIVDTDTMEFEAVKNPHADEARGAGVKAAELVIDQGVEMLLTGDCGPSASRVLGRAEVKVVKGVSRTVKDALEKAKE
jgi:predicted Fe-Mo cluster-binding NifX family protein